MNQLPTSVNHIGIAVRSINKALSFYEQNLHLKVEKIVEVPTQKVRVAFIPIGDCKLELLEPLTEDSPVAKFIEKRGEGLHHIAYSVVNIEKRLEQLQNEGIKLINEKPVIGAGGHPIAFLHPSNASGVLTELCEEPEKDD
ncbi:methylmalonyl-CoA epimerase [Evansella sp. AB-rgal1]|uniref:methylmalonyl-CoA epimerase n=1 Tax=Evansella sp. AB-rgal1 TaxID=3242696 RepID=UPI00359D4DFF